MSTRLHIKGWDIRFCPDACVYEEGIVYLFPLFRQRRRWLEGTIRRYLEYSFQAMFSKKMSHKARFDMAMYITEFIMPMWFMMEVTFRIIKLFADKVDPFSLHNTLWSSLIVSAVVGAGFFMTIRYSLRRYDNFSRADAFRQALETTIYMLTIWFPMEIFICGKILFCKKDMNWGKTAHGLVQHEHAIHRAKEKIRQAKEELKKLIRAK
jgi:1,2-diacylglycerol 3-beta-glucosyltransferase